VQQAAELNSAALEYSVTALENIDAGEVKEAPKLEELSPHQQKVTLKPINMNKQSPKPVVK